MNGSTTSPSWASHRAKSPGDGSWTGITLIINYFVLGDQVVMTPTFVGSEPVIATSGKYKGTSILQDRAEQGTRDDQRSER